MLRQIERNRKKKSIEQYKKENGLSSRELNRNLIQFKEKTSVNTKYELAITKEEDTDIVESNTEEVIPAEQTNAS